MLGSALYGIEIPYYVDVNGSKEANAALFSSAKISFVVCSCSYLYCPSLSLNVFIRFIILQLDFIANYDFDFAAFGKAAYERARDWPFYCKEKCENADPRVCELFYFIYLTCIRF